MNIVLSFRQFEHNDHLRWYYNSTHPRIPIRRKMKIASLIMRVLLGLTFFVFGLNPFLNFLPAMTR